MNFATIDEGATPHHPSAGGEIAPRPSAFGGGLIPSGEGVNLFGSKGGSLFGAPKEQFSAQRDVPAKSDLSAILASPTSGAFLPSISSFLASPIVSSANPSSSFMATPAHTANPLSSILTSPIHSANPLSSIFATPIRPKTSLLQTDVGGAVSGRGLFGTEQGLGGKGAEGQGESSEVEMERLRMICDANPTHLASWLR